MPFQLDTNLINSFGSKLVSDIGTSLDSSGSTASGKTKQSIRFEYSGNSFKLYGRAYIGALEFGRKPASGGNGSLRAALRQWIDDKGITPIGISKDSLAFLIQRKMNAEGDLLFRTGQNYQGQSKPTQIINGVINDGRIKQLGESLIFIILK
jgi:hypothetical protein